MPNEPRKKLVVAPLQMKKGGKKVAVKHASKQADTEDLFS